MCLLSAGILFRNIDFVLLSLCVGWGGRVADFVVLNYLSSVESRSVDVFLKGPIK